MLAFILGDLMIFDNVVSKDITKLVQFCKLWDKIKMFPTVTVHF